MTVLAFALAFIAEFLSEVWGIRLSRAVNSRLPLGKENMRRRVRRTLLWTVLLLALGWVDVASALSGMPLSAVILGSLTGGMAGAYVTMWRRWREVHARLAASKDPEGEDD